MKMTLKNSKLRFLTLMVLALGLSACGQGSRFFDLPDTYSTFRKAHLLAPDQHAIKAAQHVIALGGNAVDITVAMGFSSVVSLPARSSLRAHGQCLVYSAKAERAFSFDFTQENLSLLQGLMALHATHGALPWSGTLSSAHALALQDNLPFSTMLNGGEQAIKMRPTHLLNASQRLSARPKLAQAFRILMEHSLEFERHAPFNQDPMWAQRVAIKNADLFDTGENLLALPAGSGFSPQQMITLQQDSSSTLIFGASDKDGQGAVCGITLDAPFGSGWDQTLDVATTQPPLPRALARLLLSYNPSNFTLKWLAGFAPNIADKSIYASWQSLLQDNLPKLGPNVGYALSYCPLGLPTKDPDTPPQCLTMSGASDTLAFTSRE